MSTIMVKAGQSLIDIAVEHCGDISAVIDLAVQNGISITDTLTAGTTLTPVAVVDKKTATLFGNLLHKPATALTRADEAIVEGITPVIGIFDYTFDETYN